MARDSSDVEVRALRVFENDLPDECIENEESQDKQHLDYTLHLRDRGQPSGIQFAVQVKGVARPRGRRRISKSFKRQHLEYWIERSRLPVFIILVDVAGGRAHFRFVREWARFFGTKWKEQASTTVHIPLENQVADHRKFVEALRLADLEMNRAAGGKAIASLRDIDDRFSYDLTNTAGGEQVVTLRAREALEVRVTGQGEAAKKMMRMVRSGLPQQFQPGDLRFDGGPLFDHLRAQAGDRPIWFQLVAERDCHIALLTEGAAGERVRAVEGLRGRLSAGSERVEYSASMRGGPLAVKGYFAATTEPGGNVGLFNLTVHGEMWKGQRLPNLVNIERVQRLADALAEAKKASLRFSVDGVPVEPPIDLDMELVAKLNAELMPFVDLYSGLCDVARKLGVSPTLPNMPELSDAALEQIGAIIELCRNGELSTRIDPTETEAQFRLNESAEFPADQLSEGRFLLSDASPAEIFGEASARFLVVRHLGPFCLADGEEPPTGAIPGESIRLKLKTVPEALIVHRLQEPQELGQPTIHPSLGTNRA